MKNLHWWALIMCIPLYGFWTIPSVTKTRPVLTQAVAVEVAKKDKLQATLVDLESQKEELEASVSEVSLIEMIPPVLEQEFLLLDLRRITQSAGFTTTGFNFSKGQHKGTNAAEMKVTMSVEGERSNLVKLLKLIETNERFMGLDDLNFSTRPGSSITSASLSLYALAQQF